MPDVNMEKKGTLEKLLYDDLPQKFPETYEEVLDFFNIDYFPSFRDRLTNYLTERMPDHCKLTPEQFLKQQIKANACSDIPESTIRKWFSDGDRTSKTATTRMHMFRIAFALSLDEEETAKLMVNVYLDIPYNTRNHREYIFRYCLKNHLSYTHALSLIGRVSASAPPTDQTISSIDITKKFNTVEDEAVLLDFIHSHAHNFTYNLKSAHAKIDYYWEEAKKIVWDRLDSERDAEEKKHKYMYKEKYQCAKHLPDALVYRSMTGITTSQKKGTKPVSLKNTGLPKELIINFPTTPHREGTQYPAEEARKMLIFLYSFCFWNKHLESDEDIMNDYEWELNELLSDVGFSDLVLFNPFDWLFMRCARMRFPWETFQDWFDEVVHSKQAQK